MIVPANRRLRLLTFSCAAALAMSLASAASAQEAADQVPQAPQNVPEATEPTDDVGPGGTPESGEATAADESGSTLEDIYITAERRDQSLQDVPISATVFSANEIARRGITNVADIQQAAPSVAINTVNRSTFINIRGVGIAQSAPTSNPGIAYYIDGQLIPHEQFIGQSFYDIGAIEVLRGPQGTLTGQNSTGGAIYVRTPEPKFNDTSGYIEQTIGNFDNYRTTAAVNFGPNDNVAVRIAAIHDQRDSFVTNIGPSVSDPGSFDLDAVRVNLALRSSDQKLKVNVRGDYFDYRSDNIAVKNRGDLVVALRDPAQPAIDPRQNDPFVIREDAFSYLNQQGYRLSGELRYDLSEAVQVRALTSLQDGYTHDQSDGDRGIAPVNLAQPTARRGRVSRAETDFKTWISEVNLLSIGKGDLQWVVGAFYLTEDIPLLQLRDDRNTVNIVSATLVRTVTEAHNTSKSLFGQLNWFATPQIELIAGARYSWDKQVYDRYEVSRTITGGIATAVTPVPIIGTQKSTALTGKVGVNFHLNDQTLLYATASKGYKAGGVNLTPNTPGFGPETNFVYEVGFKTELLDRHLRVNGDVFRSIYKDIQLASLLNGLPLTQNAASGNAWGAELEVTAQFGGFSANAGIGWLDAQFSKSVCINNTNNPTGTPALCGNADEQVPAGRDLPFSPSLTVNAGAQYAIDLGGVTVTPRLQWAHLSSQLATPFPSAFTVVPGRDVLDARLTVDVGERFRIEAYVNNLTDETYISSQIQNASSANGGYIYGAPRQYGLRGTVRF